MNINYYVRTTGERVFNYSPLEYTILTDTEHNSCKHYFNTLDMLKDENFVLLEDDLVLCNNFKKEIENVINEHPNTIINFFTLPSSFTTTHYSTNFAYNQCTYFPKGSLQNVLNYIKQTKRYLF